MMTKLHELHKLGQSIWLDFLQRPMLTSGELERLIDQGLRGMTSNPTIFEKAITESNDYREQMQALVAQGKSAQDIYEALVIQDIQDAADLFLPVYQQHDEIDGLAQNFGHDGYVSLEANPHLANDTEATIEEIRRLHKQVKRPNVMFKVPATPAGIPAITQLISDGININVTLMFSVEHYEAVAEAYMRGLEKRLSGNQTILNIASVASVFVSRVDAKLDPLLEKIGHDELKGKIGIANATQIYQLFNRSFTRKRWQELAANGARAQRVLWGSTSTKDPAYPDTLYVDNLIGAKTVNTVPLDTLEAFMDHGTVAHTIDQNLPEAQKHLEALNDAGFDITEIGDELQAEGVGKFVRSYDNLIQAIEKERDAVAETH